MIANLVALVAGTLTVGFLYIIATILATWLRAEYLTIKCRG